MELTRRQFLKGTAALGVAAVIAPIIPAASRSVPAVTQITYKYFAHFDIQNWGGIDKLWADGILIYDGSKKLRNEIKVNNNKIQFRDLPLKPYNNKVPSISTQSYGLIKPAKIIWCNDITEVIRETTGE